MDFHRPPPCALFRLVLKWFCMADIFLLSGIILCKRLCLFPFFLAKGAVYLRGLKSEVSASCLQDRISNKNVNGVSALLGVLPTVCDPSGVEKMVPAVPVTLKGPGC